MKAILLAGGQGERLWPMSAVRSKCTAPLLGQPVLLRAARRLAQAGVDQLMVTLRRGDCAARACLTRAEDLGLEVLFREESQPLGTAGALLACAGFLDEEPFLTVCGDIVWDFDLAPALALHRARGAAATLLLSHSDHPERYGAATCDQTGRVVYFEEKPPLARCESLTVSTGITVCAPEMLDGLQPGEDMARDLFPRLMEQGKLWGAPVEGYWRDVGSPGDLLLCGAQLLSGRTGQALSLPQRRPGIYAADPLPRDVDFVPPCWLGSGVTIGGGSLIGPHAILEDGAAIGARSLVQRALVDGAQVGERATVYGAVVCREAKIGRCCVLNEGSVVGPGAVLGDNVVLMEGVRVAPSAQVPAATRLDAPPPRRADVPAIAARDEWKNSLYFL